MFVLQKVDIDSRLLLVDQFCFSNGTISFNVDLSCPSEECDVALLLCQEDDLIDIRHIQTENCDSEKPSIKCDKRSE